MKIKIALFFLLIGSLSIKAEILITFDLDYCTDSASHIFRAKILNEKGLLEVNQVYFGKSTVKNITLPDLAIIKKEHPDYVPSDEFQNWEIMVFLNEMNPSKQTFIPAFDLAKSSFDLAVSIFCIKNNKVYYSFDSYDSNKVIFGEVSSLLKMEKRMKDMLEVKTEIKRIEKKKRCQRKMKLFSRVFNKNKYQEKVYDAVLKMNCEQQVLQFLEMHLANHSYQWVYRRMISDYVRFGKENKRKKIEAIFESEFTFWKNYVQTNPNKKWWRDEEMKHRLYYISNLIFAIVRNEVGSWEEHVKKIDEVFVPLEKYQKAERDMTINQRLQRVLKQKINN